MTHALKASSGWTQSQASWCRLLFFFFLLLNALRGHSLTTRVGGVKDHQSLAAKRRAQEGGEENRHAIGVADGCATRPYRPSTSAITRITSSQNSLKSALLYCAASSASSRDRLLSIVRISFCRDGLRSALRRRGWFARAARCFSCRMYTASASPASSGGGAAGFAAPSVLGDLAVALLPSGLAGAALPLLPAEAAAFSRKRSEKTSLSASVRCRFSSRSRSGCCAAITASQRCSYEDATVASLVAAAAAAVAASASARVARCRL